MGSLATGFGRLLVACLFLLGGIQKLQTFDFENGGELSAEVAPRLDHFLNEVQKLSGIDIPLKQEHYPMLIFASIVLEITGGVLFCLNSVFGSIMLMLFLLGVTPVMHNFWDLKPDTEEFAIDFINFMKNVAIFGGILAYTAKPVINRKGIKDKDV